MAVKAADLEAEVIETVCERVRERLPDDEAPVCEAFVRHYYHWVPANDLRDRDAKDLYGAAIAHWNLAQQRAPEEIKLRVYNPDPEQDGWHSEYCKRQQKAAARPRPFAVGRRTQALSSSSSVALTA